MFLAPFQFSDRLRKRYTSTHHLVGYIYVVGILFLAPLGIYVQYISETLDLYAAVVHGAGHRRRGDACTSLVFFEGRLILGLTGLETADITIVQAVIWSCLALSVPVADVINDWAELRRTATVAVRSPRADAPAPGVLAPSA